MKSKSLEDNNSNSNETIDFEQFLSLFEDVELPLVLDESFCSYKVLSKKDTIKADFVVLFIEKDTVLNAGVSLFYYYKFYPMVKFHVSSSIIGVIYAESGIAGGVEDRGILNLYTASGKKIDELIVWEEAGEGEYMREITSIIISNKISLIETGTEIDYDEDTGKGIEHETFREEREYKIDTVHGKIEILKEDRKR